MLLFGKQFKILNKKLNAILQSQADTGGSQYVSCAEIDEMLKSSEARLFDKFFGIIQETEFYGRSYKVQAYG